MDPTLAATGVLGGLVVAGVAVGSAAILGDNVSVEVWIGVAVVGAIGSAVLMAAKKWAQDLVQKLVELPSKSDIFVGMSRIETQSTRHNKQVIDAVAKLEIEVYDVKDSMQKQFHGLEIRTGALEERHRTIDRIHAENA